MVFEHNYNDFPELTNRQLNEFGFSSPHVQITSDFFAKVVKVIDGDTLSIRTSSRDFDFPLRLLDVDAPEMNAGGGEARDWAKERLEGEEVKVLINPKNRVGKYGRLLGKIFHRGMDLGQEMIYLGLVKPFGSINEGKLEPLDKIFRVRQWL